MSNAERGQSQDAFGAGILSNQQAECNGWSWAGI